MSNIDKCKRKGNFWSGFNDYYDHKWRYISKEERICDVCQEMELFFGFDDHSEDWRPKA